MARPSLFSISLCLLALFLGSCLARQNARQQFSQQQNECQIDRLDSLQPTNRIESEAGVTEVWDPNHRQFRCAGVTVVRHRIQPNGLLLPSFVNAPQLIYIVRGRGIQGTMIPGCPETFQESQGSQQGSQRFQDQHQKIRHFREGDVIAVPAGTAYWSYNDGDSPLVSVILIDNSNFANQLDRNPRRFYLAGNPRQEHRQQSEREEEEYEYGRPQQEGTCNNVLCGFDARLLAEAFNIDIETARRLQSQNDRRGNIVNVRGRELHVVRPPLRREDERQQQQQHERPPYYGGDYNGLEETFCTMRLRENIGDPSRADIYTPQAGRVSTLNSHNLPILRWLQLSAERGVLYRNAMMVPHYNLNAHSVMYVIRGRARVQVVNQNGRAVYDGEVREGQVLTLPQNFAVVKRAMNEQFEWVSFKTNDKAVINPLAGKTSVMRAMPEEVIANAYQISREEARRIKFNKKEATLTTASSSSSSPYQIAEA